MKEFNELEWKKTEVREVRKGDYWLSLNLNLVMGPASSTHTEGTMVRQIVEPVTEWRFQEKIFEKTGEVRRPRKDEWYLCPTVRRPVYNYFDLGAGEFPILRQKEEAGEVVNDWKGEFRKTGEVRVPRKGDFYQEGGSVLKAVSENREYEEWGERFPILVKVEETKREEENYKGRALLAEEKLQKIKEVLDGK